MQSEPPRVGRAPGDCAEQKEEEGEVEWDKDGRVGSRDEAVQLASQQSLGERGERERGERQVVRILPTRKNMENRFATTTNQIALFQIAVYTHAAHHEDCDPNTCSH